MEIIKKYSGVLPGLFILFIYALTLAPSVTKIDSGELTAVQALLGIAHPTGYPLFTLIGFLWQMLPLPMETVTQLNLLSALFTAGGSIFFYYSASLTLDNLSLVVSAARKEAAQEKQPKRKKKDAGKKAQVKALDFTAITPYLRYLLTIFGTLFISFNVTYWSQSTAVEVYSLHILLINAALYFLIRAFIATRKEEKGKEKWYLLFAIALALGFTNHMSTLMLLPGAAVLYFSINGFGKEAFRRIGKMLLFFFPVLIAVYAYLPLRASTTPLLNWGNPSSLDNLLRHITGKQYQVWLFSSFESAKEHITGFFNTLPSQFGIPLNPEFSFGIIVLFVLAAILLIWQFIRSKKIYLFFSVNIIFTVFYAGNYDIHDLDPYFLLAYINIVLLIVLIITEILGRIEDNKLRVNLPTILLTMLIILQLTQNFGKTDESDNYTYEDYTLAALEHCEEDALILTYQWDYFLSPSYYFQYVKNIRTDVAVIGKELLRRSWYYDQMEQAFPDVIENIRPEAEIFLREVKPFEEGEQFDPAPIEQAYRNVMSSLITKNIANRTCYIAPELVENEMKQGLFSLPQGYYLVPDLFFFKVVADTGYVPADEPDFTIRFQEEDDYYTERIKRFTANMLLRRAMYEMTFQKKETAAKYVKKVEAEFAPVQIPPNLQFLLKYK